MQITGNCPAQNDEQINSNFVPSQCGVSGYKKLFVLLRRRRILELKFSELSLALDHHAKFSGLYAGVGGAGGFV